MTGTPKALLPAAVTGRSDPDREAGFILSETLIALTIIAMAVSLFLAAAAAILDHVERAERRAMAATVAAGVIAEARLGPRGCPAPVRGEREGMAFELAVDCETDPAPPAFLGLARLSVAVTWRERPEPASLELETWHWVFDDG